MKTILLLRRVIGDGKRDRGGESDEVGREERDGVEDK